jgi:hypothetical protein
MIGMHRLWPKRNESRDVLKPLSAWSFGSVRFDPSLRTASEVVATMSDWTQGVSCDAHPPSGQVPVRADA